MIKFQSVSKIYLDTITAVDNVSFQIDKGEFVCIVGKSGAGKTTLLKLLLAMEAPTKGNVFFKESDVSKLEDISKLRKEVGIVFQDYRLFPSKNVYENIAYVMELMGNTCRQIATEVPQILEIVGLEDRAYSFPFQLSGGEKQRAAIARAIAHRPQVVLADEPIGNLDPYYTQDIIKLLKKINQMGTTVILATHSKEVIDNLGERVISIDRGKIIMDEKNGRFII